MRGRMPQDEPDAPLVGQQVDDGFVEVAVEADVGDLPDLDRTVLGRGRDHRVVVRAPLDVQHGGAVTRHQRSVAVYPTDLHRPTRQGVKLGGTLPDLRSGTSHLRSTTSKLVAWLSGRMSVSGRRTYPVLSSTCS